MRRSRVALAAAGLLAIGLGVAGLDRAFPPELGRLEQVGGAVLARDGQVVGLRPAAGGVWRLRGAADAVSPVFLRLLIATEDRRFWGHPGVDPIALGRALLQDVRAGRVVSGGSTLTMQVVRLLHPRPRGLRAKLIEAARAVQLEWHLSKPEILSAWLTLAPYGGNLEGVEAGALAWCGMPASGLTPEDSALLVAIPRRPEGLRPDRHAARAAAVRDRILRAGGWPAPDRAVVAGRRAMPRAGPELAGASGRTTLDATLQAALRRLLQEAVAGLPERASAAIVLAEAETGAIRAVASGSGPAEARAGSLDLTRAVRSPGSALKPFIYGLAFQDGVIGPQTPVDDLPRRFGFYAPENFDRVFSGGVTAAEALRRSLNLPAVALLDRVGAVRFAAVLTAAGVRPRLPPGADPSLPLALGGAGVTARELGGLYAGLATDGRARRLRLQDQPERLRLLTPGAASLVAEALTRRLPEGGPRGLAWKTGTSWGGRDSWAAGFDARFVVVAWVGRPDGTPLPDATGRSLALPLLARAYGLLPAAPRPEPVVAAVAASVAPARDLRLLFPPPGAELAGDAPVVLRAMGGRRPLSFLVDGVPVPADAARRQAAWQPPGPGFYRVTVLDSDGAAARAQFRVR